MFGLKFDMGSLVADMDVDWVHIATEVSRERKAQGILQFFLFFFVFRAYEHFTRSQPTWKKKSS